MLLVSPCDRGVPESKATNGKEDVAAFNVTCYLLTVIVASHLLELRFFL